MAVDYTMIRNEDKDKAYQSYYIEMTSTKKTDGSRHLGLYSTDLVRQTWNSNAMILSNSNIYRKKKK